jgi:hypothetical protein
LTIAHPETVTTVMVKRDTDRYDLTIRSGPRTAVIDTTRNHLFWDAYLHYWVAANKLSKGEHLKTPDGATVTVVGGTTPKQHDGWMWDLSVPGGGDHDFYVVAGSASVLVHNCDLTPAEDDEPDVTFGHGARHLVGTGLDQGDVEAAIEAQVTEGVSGSSSTGSFWGRVAVSGQTIKYRAYTLPDGVINVGTYYVP